MSCGMCTADVLCLVNADHVGLAGIADHEEGQEAICNV